MGAQDKLSFQVWLYGELQVGVLEVEGGQFSITLCRGASVDPESGEGVLRLRGLVGGFQLLLLLLFQFLFLSSLLLAVTNGCEVAIVGVRIRVVGDHRTFP